MQEQSLPVLEGLQGLYFCQKFHLCAECCFYVMISDFPLRFWLGITTKDLALNKPISRFKICVSFYYGQRSIFFPPDIWTVLLAVYVLLEDLAVT